MRKDNMGWAFHCGGHVGHYPKFRQANANQLSTSRLTDVGFDVQFVRQFPLERALK